MTNILLGGIRRRSCFPYRLMALGWGVDECIPVRRTFHFTDRFEVCLRMSSSMAEAVDSVDGIVSKTPFPHVIIKPPGVDIVYEVPDVRSYFHLQYPAELFEVFKGNDFLPLEPVWRLSITPETALMVDDLRVMMDHSLEYGMADRLDLCGFQLLQEMVLIKKEPCTENNSRQNQIMRISSYFRTHYCSGIDLDEVLRHNGMSRRSFFRHWKHYFKCSPAEYIVNLRLEEVARRLADTDEAVGEIAERLNFSDPAYLSSVFRGRYNMTPLQYRSLQRRGRKK